MEAIVAELLKLGLPGLFIAYLIWDRREFKNDLAKANDQILILQDKRIAESKEQGEVIRGNMTALNTMNEKQGTIIQLLSSHLQNSRQP